VIMEPGPRAIDVITNPRPSSRQVPCMNRAATVKLVLPV
jgi:hypothetical protein